ncbi:MAG TPA: AAA family ATPase [Steroidobacteraceae bacterium]|nr:AAA family ATPase [Steroidobacteraceae bacterium]
MQTHAATDPHAELRTLLSSRVALLAVESRDETRALALLRDAGLHARRAPGSGIFIWSATEGLKRIDRDMGAPQRHLIEPAQMLRHLKSTPMAGIYILLDFHPYLADPVNIRMLKDVVQDQAKVARTVVLVSHEITLPAELVPLAARFRPALPSAAERQKIVTHVFDEWRRQHKGRAPRIDRDALARVIDNLAGLSAPDAERLVRRVLYDDGAITAEDLRAVQAGKYELLNRHGTLGFEPDTARFAEVGGLANLRRWVETRRAAFDGTAPGLDAPRGVLLLGVQGCGKSLAARAIAGIFGVPLLRFDFAALYSKWHGESEQNLRETLATATALAPCVLWIDEIEKALASGEGDSGTGRRVLGAFLTWMAERRTRVFLVATANDVSALPPELIRKGRFDEIFFVDLPDAETRAAILGIHAARRNVPLTGAELARLAAMSGEFSGAELEQAIVAALYTAHAQGAPVDAASIAREIGATRPLAVVMAEQVAALRRWAQGRTVRAD